MFESFSTAAVVFRKRSAGSLKDRWSSSLDAGRLFVRFSVRTVPHCFSNADVWGGPSMTGSFPLWLKCRKA